ncbi:amidase [Falsigemmobacter faecalis]|uniref:Amidase n=1 Tax=Falsigemmobacter faecalis TaxID=2488730 RepID=A0A3P3DV85_9RHOB|nr:amidase family protein [Falsigemmobacter faecalis]RRH77362.1 amidase [Falsigemmobacter faecalis]
MSADWLKTSAADLGRGIAAGRIDPVALTETFLEAAENHPETARIYARLTPGRATAEALAARGRAATGTRVSKLDGVPVSWKDLFDSAGVATEAGSALLKDRVPLRDAPVLAQGSASGLVCLGKTHMSELAFSGLGLNPVTATPPNVNDPKAVPGGSSSGAAASVAFGLAAASIGSDTGGSVRIPAAWNDLVGYKPVVGRVNTAGSVPLCERFDTVGPICRTVEDCALTFAAFQGEAPVDFSGPELGNRRIAVLDSVALDDLREAPARAFEDGLKRLSEGGAGVVHIRFPEMAEALQLAGSLFTAEAWGIWREVIEANPTAMFPRIYERFRSGAEVMAADYVAAWRRLEEIRRSWAKATAGFDAVALPTSPILPPDAERLMSDSAYYVTENLLALRNTRIGNLMDAPAISLPTREASCGFMLLASGRADASLLRLAAAAEKVLR